MPRVHREREGGGKEMEFEIASGICVGTFLTQPENMGGLYVTDV